MTSYYIFDIQISPNHTLRLTSSDIAQRYNDVTYQPYSGLNITKLSADDSGDNIVVIKGIYHQMGVKQDDNISDAFLTIHQIWNNQSYLLGKFICTFYTQEDLGFTLICNSEIIKLEKPLLQTFSKTCRANFGDHKCRAKIEDFIIFADIVEYHDGRFTYSIGSDIKVPPLQSGILYLLDNAQQEVSNHQIIAHTGNMIEIEKKIDIQNYNKIKIKPSCDKKYQSCCYYFNNAVNFRGEPDIPDFNLIAN